jgi:hypothetical protein
MAADLDDRLAIFVGVRRFPCMGVAASRLLRSSNYVRNSACIVLFVDLLIFPFDGVWGM